MSALWTSATDITILLVIVGVVLILLASMEHRRRNRSHPGAKPRRRTSAGRSGSGPGYAELSDGDATLLKRFSWVLRGPGDLKRVMIDRDFFMKAARRAIREGILTEGELLRLARNAKFSITRISSEEMNTLKLASGVEVSVADQSMTSGSGTLTSVEADALHLRLRRGQTHFPMGTRLDVVCNSPQGLVRFLTVVTAVRGKSVLLQHTHDVEQVQRRRHRRRDVQFAGQLVYPGNPAGARTRTLDLSIGGCACKNPDRTLKAGDQVKMSLQTPQKRINIPAQVVRTSRGGRVLHLQFGEIPDASRHLLFKTIVAASR